jgi:NADH-ubiquinone oxidoreductase chain 6
MSTIISLNIKSLLIEFLVLNAIASAILVIIAKNPVISVVYLISLVLNSALYLIVKGMSFLGIAYILIYLGAIIVLFLFVIMMINIKLTDILETGYQYTKNIPLALIVSGLFLYECFNILPYYLNNSTIPLDHSFIFNFFKFIIFEMNRIIIPIEGLNGEMLTNVDTLAPLLVSNNWPEILVLTYTHIISVAYGLYTYGALGFLLCGIILLLAMIAPIYLSRN